LAVAPFRRNFSTIMVLYILPIRIEGDEAHVLRCMPMRLFEGGNVRSRVEDGMEVDAVVCVRAEMHGALDEATQVAKVRRHRWNKHRPALAAAVTTTAPAIEYRKHFGSQLGLR
jgi:hypothetical protein